ncbi:MAG: hypothetical protein M3081_09145 [Gemmatimonadota bacterium]|nr:hypothetical protein [Gemmatimonadota bacterium]
MNIHPARAYTLLLGVFTALAVGSASPAHAQFGALKKLKDKVTGAADSTAKKDTTKAATDTTKAQGQSLFSKAKSIAGAASDKLEATTGISAKDAALTATGMGAANMIAKKVGGAGDASGAGGVANAIGKAMSGGVNPAQGATGAAQGVLQQLGAAQMGAGRAAAALPGGLPGIPSAMTGVAPTSGIVADEGPEERTVIAFQQELMQVGMRASNGDAAAKARLEAWQALVMRYQPQITKLQSSVMTGDLAVAKALQDVQLKMMREWLGTPAVKLKKP